MSGHLRIVGSEGRRFEGGVEGMDNITYKAAGDSIASIFGKHSESEDLNSRYLSL